MFVGGPQAQRVRTNRQGSTGERFESSRSQRKAAIELDYIRDIAEWTGCCPQRRFQLRHAAAIQRAAGNGGIARDAVAGAWARVAREPGRQLGSRGIENERHSEQGRRIAASIGGLKMQHMRSL